MIDGDFNVGVLVWGPPSSPRVLVRHHELLVAAAENELDIPGEAYLSHFVFDREMQRHYEKNRNSVAGFQGPCWARWIVLDVDRPNLNDALRDTCRVVAFIQERYPESDLPIYFSGNKGFHILIELTHAPPPAAMFHEVARTFAEALAGKAGVRIDTSIYDKNHLVRLPNSRHPRTGLFKRRIDADDLFEISVEGIRRHAANPAGDGVPLSKGVSARLIADWKQAEAETARRRELRETARCSIADASSARAPRYLIDFIRFGVPEGHRHKTLFQCAAWLSEMGAPPSLIHALLIEPGTDVGLTLKDVIRQIQCGIEHSRKQRIAAAAGPDAAERWAIEHENDPLPPGALDFPFGALAPESEGGQR